MDDPFLRSPQLVCNYLRLLFCNRFFTILLEPPFCIFGSLLGLQRTPNGSKTPKVGLRRLFFSYICFHHESCCFFDVFLMFFKDLESLPASARLTKYALFKKSVFPLPHFIAKSFATSFWSSWPPRIGLNCLW